MIRFAFALLFFGQAMAAVAQQPVARDAPAADRPVTLRGRVLVADTSAPLRRARVTVVVNGQAADPLFSDAAGRFDVEVPQKGGYTLRVAKAGFVTQDLTKFAAVGGIVDVRLVPGAAVVGRVFDQNGDALVGVTIHIRRIEDPPAANCVAFDAETDDLGEFRAAGLAPGQYAVVAGCGQMYVTTLNSGRMSFVPPREQIVDLRAGQEAIVNVAAVPRPPPVYLADIEAQVLARAASGGTASGGSTASAPRPTQGVVVRGRVTGPDGEAVANAAVSLSGTSTGPSGSSVSMRGGITDARGRFEFAGVGAGRYTVVARKAGLAQAGDAQGSPTTQGVEVTIRDREQPDSIVIVLGKGGVLSGRVTDSTGRPVTGVTVRAELTRVLPTPPPVSQLVEMLAGALPTDAEGRFELTDVPAGVLRVGVLRRGALPAEQAIERQTVVLDEGQRLDGLNFVLPVGGVISGRIVDELGEPMEGVTVQALRAGRTGGVTLARPVEGNPMRKTDDRGLYRLYGLPPGPYYLVASERRTLATGGLQVETSPRVYYPDRPSIAGAQPLQVDSGSEVTGVNVTVAPFDGARIAGVALHSTGTAVVGTALLTMSSRGGTAIPEPLASAIGLAGDFEFRHVPPGDYVVQIIARRQWGVSEEFAAQPVRVEGTEPVPLVITTSTPSTLIGKIRLEGALATLVPSSFEFRALPADPDGLPALPVERTLEPRSVTRDDWTFEITRLTGPARISASAPDGWWLRSVTIDGTNAADEPFAFGTRERTRTDVEVVFSSGAAAIAGRVWDGRRQPVIDCSVIVFPVDSSRIYPGSRYVKLVRSGLGGRFSVSSLPPGEYWAVAVNDVIGDAPSADVLTGLLSGAHAITLGDAENATTDLLLAR